MQPWRCIPARGRSWKRLPTPEPSQTADRTAATGEGIRQIAAEQQGCHVPREDCERPVLHDHPAGGFPAGAADYLNGRPSAPAWRAVVPAAAMARSGDPGPVRPGIQGPVESALMTLTGSDHCPRSPEMAESRGRRCRRFPDHPLVNGATGRFRRRSRTAGGSDAIGSARMRRPFGFTWWRCAASIRAGPRT